MSRMAEQIGRVLGGRYRLLAPIGRGASAQVFVADDVRLNRRVAVKVLHDALADDQEFLRRFRTEAQAAAALNHRHVVSVYDWGQDDDEIPWIVTEYLGGGSLRALLDRGHRLTPSQALVVGLQTAQGLDYAHTRGFVHRDIKPANLLFDDQGELRIADFGLARALAEAAWTEPQGSVVGTARYASPEQAQGMPLSGRADVYSLALVLVEAVTGEVPFSTDTTLGTLMARIGKPLPAPESLGPLAPVVVAAGDPDPEARLDARRLAAGLTRIASALPRPGALPLAGATEVDLDDDRDPTLMAGAGALLAAGAAGAAVSEAELDDEDQIDTVAIAAGAAADTDGTAADTDTDDEDTDDDLDVPAFLAGAPTVPLGAGGPDAPDDEADLADAVDPTVVVPSPVASVGPWAAASAATTVVPDAALVDADDDDVDDPPWDPRSPTGRRRRRWPLVILIVLLVAGLGAAVGLLVADIAEGTPTHRIPPVTGLSEDEAIDTLTALGFEVEVERKRVDDTEAGDVLGTRPERGRELEEGQTVVVLVSEGQTLVDMPPITRGMPAADAEDVLSFSALVPVPTEAYDEEVPAGHVVDLTSDLPDRVEKGTEVEYVVSLGPEPRTVPDGLAGMTEQEATSALSAVGLVPAVDRQHSDTVEVGTVISTSPASGEQAARDSEVVVVVSLGPELVVVPDISGAESLGDAVRILEGAGLVAGDVQGPAAGQPAGTDPEAGTEVRKGSEVDIILRRRGPGGDGDD